MGARRWAFGLVPLLLFFTSLSGPGAAVARGAEGCDPRWTIVPAPVTQRMGSVLFGVGAVDANDVWAVGSYTGSGDGGDPLAMHWDGARWTEASTPALDGWVALQGAAALASDGGWAGGNQNQLTGMALIEHWDGAEWIAETPQEGFLTSVDSASSDDVWAVGQQSVDGVNQTLALHWDGHLWKAVDTPSITRASNQLNDVTVISSTDAWAVGQAVDVEHSRAKALALHWDGTSWSRVSVPGAGAYPVLTGVTAISSSDVWAVGFSQGRGPLAYHWDGVAWTRVRAPGSAVHAPEAVAAVASDDVWLVGWYWSESHTSDTGFAEHWDGNAWSSQNL